jgi:hypothetical protein
MLQRQAVTMNYNGGAWMIPMVDKTGRCAEQQIMVRSDGDKHHQLVLAERSFEPMLLMWLEES